MSGKREASVWMLVAVVVILFVLSVVAPRQWQSVAISPIDPPRPTASSGAVPRAQTLLESGRPPLLFGRMEGRLAVAIHAAAAGESTPVSHDEHHRPARDIANGQSPAEKADRLPKPVFADDTQYPPTEAPQPAEGAKLALRTIVPRQTLGVRPPVPVRFLAGPGERGEAADIAAPMPPARLDGVRQAERQSPLWAASASGPTLDRRVVANSADVITRWPHPQQLVAELDALIQHEICRDWCQPVLEDLSLLQQQDQLDAVAVRELLARLDTLAAEGLRRASAAESNHLSARWLRAVGGLRRRLDIWQQVQSIAASATFPVSFAIADAAHLQEVFAALDQRLTDTEHADDWRQYLLVEETRKQFAQGFAGDTSTGRSLAKRVLLRMDSGVLSPQQRSFLAQPEFIAYAVEMRQLAAEPVDYFRLLDTQERYELDGATVDALQLAAAQLVLRWSHNPEVAELSRRLDTRYREANVRVTISGDLINRLVPAQPTRTERVDDVILGARTYGSSETVSDVSVRLLPSPDAWRLELRAAGEVASRTCSYKGPAALYSSGHAVFEAGKELVVHPLGCEPAEAEAAAESRARLTRVRTDLDGVPLLRELARSLAIRRYGSQSRLAQRVVGNRIANEARSRLDDEVNRSLDDASHHFVKNFHEPMAQLALQPAVREMRTTEEQLIADYRLAGQHQLAAHTSWPPSPPDSRLCLQVHESAVRNFLEQLEWQGRRVRLVELHQEVAQLFRVEAPSLPEDFPEDVEVTFADEQPVRVRFQDGKLGIQLAFAELKQGRHRWQDFTVRVAYVPASAEPGADLVRESFVELVGRRLSFADQIALRGIFSRVFAKNKPIDLVTRTLRSDERLGDLHVTQMELVDGWLAVAVGPQQVASAR